MNDYKELVKRLRVAVDVHEVKGCVLEISAETCAEIADAIEQLARDNNVLTRERDTAVADLNIARSCLTCKSNGLDFCEGCDSWASKRNWEWRGVQNE